MISRRTRLTFADGCQTLFSSLPPRLKKFRLQLCRPLGYLDGLRHRCLRRRIYHRQRCPHLRQSHRSRRCIVCDTHVFHSDELYVDV